MLFSIETFRSRIRHFFVDGSQNQFIMLATTNHGRTTQDSPPLKPPPVE